MGSRGKGLAGLIAGGALGTIAPPPAVPASESPRDADPATRRAPETPTAEATASESHHVAETPRRPVADSPTPEVPDSPPARLRETPPRALADVESTRVPESPTHRRPQSPSPAVTGPATRRGSDTASVAVTDPESPHVADSPTPAIPKWKRLIRKDVHFDAGTLDVLHRETRRIQHARAGIGGERVTESTLVRVMVRAMLDHLPELQGADEETLLQSLRDAVSRSRRVG